jgi:predicted P-loop ATPase
MALLEIAELSSFNRAETETLKSFITRPTERYTPKFGRNEVIEPRQCVFMGTTNKYVYLHDETGGRRMWPARTGKIKIDELRRDRDLLFAEAVKLYRARTPWWPDRDFEAKHIRPQQAARYEADAWEQTILEYLDAKKAEPTTTIMNIARHGLKIEVPRVGTAEQRRIADVLEREGWERDEKKTETGVRWLRPASVRC